MKNVAAPLAICALLILATTSGSAEIVDVVGGTNSSGGSFNGKGNVFRVDTSTTLIEHEAWLDFTNEQTLEFYVYENTDEFGTFTRIDSVLIDYAGNGADWYSSGPINVPLAAGMYYIIGFAWENSLTYFYNTGDSDPVSFGATVHGYALGEWPMPETVETTSDDLAIYHQRLTTPEPAAFLLLAAGLLLRRRSQLH